MTVPSACTTIKFYSTRIINFGLMEHDVPTASKELLVADASLANSRTAGKDCSESLLADTDSNRRMKPCVDANLSQPIKFASTSLDDITNEFVLQPGKNQTLKPLDPIGPKAPELYLSKPGGWATIPSDYYSTEPTSRKDNDFTLKLGVEPIPNATSDYFAGIVGFAQRFGIVPPPKTPMFGGAGPDRNDGMPLTRFPARKGFSIGGSTEVITTKDYTIGLGANVGMQKVPDEMKEIYGRKSYDARVNVIIKF